MTKKDYELIADCIKAQYDEEEADYSCGTGQPKVMYEFALRIAAELKADNPSFSMAKFLAACGL